MSLPLTQALEQAEQALEAGEVEDALRFANVAIELAPEDLDALELKALSEGELGDWEAADATFEKLLRLDPSHTGGLIAAADVKIRLPGDDRERIIEGLELLERAEKHASKEETMEMELHFLRGLAFNQLGDFEDALDAFARVLDLDPDHGEALIEQSITHFEMAKFDEAKKGFTRLTREFPEEPWPYHYLGLIAERGNEDAESWFTRARTLAPDEFPLPVHLSDAEFDAAVAGGIAALPEHAKPHLDNSLITTEQLPSQAELDEGLSPTVLGVFVGTPIDERIATEAGHHETVRITLFQKNLERFVRSREELIEEIRITVLHEVGHLLGLDEDELYQRGLD